MRATFRALLLAAVGAVALSACGGAQTPVEKHRVTLDDGSIMDVEANSPDGATEIAKRRIDEEGLTKTWSPAENARRWAEEGNANAQRELGLMYDKGEGVPQDYAEAMKWYRRAADQGDALAQINIGAMFSTGEGVSQNHAEAVKWWRLAADQGNADAQTRMGLMYSNGTGVPQNDVEAVRLYRLAADQGDAFAQFSLGFKYANGTGVPQNYVEAYKWLALAAAQQSDFAGGRDGVRHLMTPAQIAEGQRLAAEWKPKK